MTHSTPTPAPFTPTHTAEGRKLTRAERKAANKAKWAAMQAAKASERKAQAPKPKRKSKQASKPAPAPMTQGLLDTWMFCAALGEAERKKASKPKRKPTANERMEARAQRESIRKQESKRAKEQAKATIVVGADGGEAQVCERRMEVPAPPKQERKPLTFDGPDFADFDGLTVEEAANLAKEQFLADVTADDCL
jgi:hypothetical protein